MGALHASSPAPLADQSFSPTPTANLKSYTRRGLGIESWGLSSPAHRPCAILGNSALPASSSGGRNCSRLQISDFEPARTEQPSFGQDLAPETCFDVGRVGECEGKAPHQVDDWGFETSLINGDVAFAAPQRNPSLGSDLDLKFAEFQGRCLPSI